MRATRIGVFLFGAGTVAIAAAYGATIVVGSAPDWAPWALAFGSAATSVGLFVFGAASRGRLPRGVRWLLGALFITILASFGAALALPASEGAGGTLVLGLPLRLAIVLYGVGFLPLLALPITFGLTFEKGAR